VRDRRDKTLRPDWINSARGVAIIWTGELASFATRRAWACERTISNVLPICCLRDHRRAKDSETPLEQHRNINTPNAKDLVLPSLPMLEYEVVRHRGYWRVLYIGKHAAPCDSQDAAIAAAVAQAKESVAQGGLALVRLERTDGEEHLMALDPPNEDK
jgi:hypothetical protein